MILKREIEKFAEQKGVAKSTIDKDWVLGHFVDAIFSVPEYLSRIMMLTTGIVMLTTLGDFP